MKTALAVIALVAGLAVGFALGRTAATREARERPAVVPRPAPARGETAAERTAWIGEVIELARTIQPGRKRAELE